MFIEQIHNECYSTMIETLIKNKNEKDNLFDSINKNETIKEISLWGLRHTNSSTYSLSHKLLVYICFEGIMFSGAFAFIYWVKSICGNGKSFMPGLIKSNEFISRDEGLHVEFGIEVFKKRNLIDDLPNYVKSSIILECVSLTKKFNKDVLRIKQTMMNEDLMNKYTEYIADVIFVSLGMDKYYNSSNPFTFMNTIGMVQKTNFHDSRPTEYQITNFSNEELSVSEDF
jgi:ribonucleoside-diphosphate reductase subunit M2